MSNLLKKVKSYPVFDKNSGNETDEDIEVSIAWLKGEITVTQLDKAKGWKHGSTCYVYFSRNLKNAFKKGLIVLK